MMRWTRSVTLEELQALNRQTADEHCGIRFTAIGEDWLEATEPLDTRTRAPNGELHNGALALLAESIGSVAANLCIDASRQHCVGQILHLSLPVSVTAGPIRARAVAVAVLKQSHVWRIEMRDAAGTTVGAAQLTMAVLDFAQSFRT